MENSNEIHNTEFSIASLNPYYIHIILYYIQSMKIAISTKIGFPYYIFPAKIHAISIAGIWKKIYSEICNLKAMLHGAIFTCNAILLLRDVN
jgi:hypothetical protein